MNPQRKRIIISEIHYWKKNRLLPEHYCDFLITLYAQGETGSGEEPEQPEKSVLEQRKKGKAGRVVLLGLMAAGLAAAMAVMDRHALAAILITCLFAAGLLVWLLASRTNSTAILPAVYIITAFLILGLSLKAWFIYFEGETTLLLGLLMLNSILWLFAGRLLILLYFTISGAAGLLMIIGFLLISY